MPINKKKKKNLRKSYRELNVLHPYLFHLHLNLWCDVFNESESGDALDVQVLNAAIPVCV